MAEIEFCSWEQLASTPDRDRLIGELDHVFFVSSARQSFDSADDKAAFRERWLGRYLRRFPQYALVAMSEGHVVGYLVGSLDDPARDPLFADLAFLAHFHDLTPRYPGQLHVNVAAGWRGRGIGACLVDIFTDVARAGGAPGVHAVTVRGMRNVGFYLANGFLERGAATIDGRELLFLGRDV